MMRRLFAFLAALFLAAQAHAGTSARDLLLLQAGNAPSLSLDFTKASLGPSVTFTRASSATVFDKTGTLQTAGSNVPRFDYDPVTLAIKGLLIEPQSTNSIRNNTSVGAVAGTPGTRPNNWTILTSNAGTLAQQIVGSSQENGITYIDYRISGTTSASGFWDLNFDASNAIAATQGQTFSLSTFIKLSSGSMSNVSLSLYVNELNSGSTYLANSPSAFFTPTGGNIAVQRQSIIRTISSATSAYVLPYIEFAWTGAVAIDITIRIGLPQIEQQPFPTSAIATSGSAATRAQDFVSSPIGPWFNKSAGTIAARALSFHLGTVGYQSEIASIGTDSSNVITIRNPASSVLANTSVILANSNIGGLGTTTLTAGTSFRTAFTYNTGLKTLTMGTNGIANGSVSFATFPSFSWFGIGGSGRGSALAGYIQSIKYWPRVLSSSELIQATK